MLLIGIMAGFLHKKKKTDNFNQNTASLKDFIFKPLNNIQNTANTSELFRRTNCQYFCNRKNHLKTEEN